MDNIIQFLGLSDSAQIIIDFVKISTFFIFGTFVLDVIRIIMYNKR